MHSRILRPLTCDQAFVFLKEEGTIAGQELVHKGVPSLIIYMKKLLDSDWLTAVQFKCNTSAKSVTPVQKV